MADYTRFETLKVEKDGRVLIVTLNRPEVLNAYNAQMTTEHHELWHEVAKDSSVGAVILTGAGRAFSAGVDMKAVASGEYGGSQWVSQPPPDIGQEARHYFEALLEVEQPIIAAINGVAAGMGATRALACDIIIMGESARIADTHVSAMAVAAGDGGVVLWPLMMPLHKAKYYLLTGKWLTAAEADRIGLVNMVVPDDQLMPTALALAHELANGPQYAIRWTKLALNKILRQAVNLLLDFSVAAEWTSFQLEDNKEAVRAFVEKRRPVFPSTQVG